MRVSLVVPAHNEAGNLERLIERLDEELGDAAFEIEIVLVNDNSTDETPDIVDTLAEADERVSVVHRTGDPGFGNAIKDGLLAATGEILIPFMGDLSDDPADVRKLVDAIEDGYDVAYGSRFVSGGSVTGYPPLKLLYNRSYNNLIRLAFGIQARDVTNAFKAYRREVIEEIGVDNLSAESFDLTVELPLRAHILGFRNTEVPVTWHSREAGVSKLNASLKGPLYLKRLLHLFVVGNLVGLRDLYEAISSGSLRQTLGAAALGVAILLALFTLSGFDGVFGVLAGTNPIWVGVAAVAYLTSFVFRTWRYRVLLRTAGHLGSRGGVFRSIMVGWFVNFILPARAGDAARGLVLKATEDVPFGVASGMVVIERILDMAVLGLVMLLIAGFFLPAAWTGYLASGALAIGFVLAGGLVGLYYVGDRVADRFEGRYPSVRRGIELLNDALERVVENPYAMALAVVISLPVWLLEASTIYFSGLAIGLNLSIVSAATTAIAAFVAQAVPVTPAGIGTYEATITAVLQLLGTEPSSGTALALVDHFTRVALVYVVGGIAAVHVGFRSRAYFRQRSQTETASPSEQP